MGAGSLIGVLIGVALLLYVDKHVLKGIFAGDSTACHRLLRAALAPSSIKVDAKSIFKLTGYLAIERLGSTKMTSSLLIE
jgi:uncharacterized membrane protein YfcA